MKNKISIKGASEHNLKKISTALPKGQIIAFTGASGAGKSTLAHHVIAKIANQRLRKLKGEQVSLSPTNPKVESIEGLMPCIELPQEPLKGSARSTVATYTGLQHLLASLLLHRGSAHSDTGEELVVAAGKPLAEWLFKFYKGKDITLAEINKKVSSTTEIKEKELYFREDRTDWNLVSLKEARKTYSAYWTMAIPHKTFKLTSPEVAAEIVSQFSSYLLVIDQNIYIESGVNRVAADQPLPYKKLSRDLFSFNSSAADAGQCDTCSGLGEIKSVTEKSIFTNENKSLFSGGLSLPVLKGQLTHMGVAADFIRGLLKSRNIPFETPIKKLPDTVRKIILHGSGGELIPEMRSEAGELKKPKKPFRGLSYEIMVRIERNGPASKILSSLASINTCPACVGSRYNRSAQTSNWKRISLNKIFHDHTVSELLNIFESNQDANTAKFTRPIHTLLAIYEKLNLGYLQLSRSTSSLSGGEAQRLKLGLVLALEFSNSLYILDEPSRGLHRKDMLQLNQTLRSIVSNGNTLILVEHQPVLIENSDYVINLGPEGGSKGGYIISESKPKKLSRSIEIEFEEREVPSKDFTIKVSKLSVNNLKNVSFKLPQGKVTAVVGVSGAGKSSAIIKGLIPAAELYLEGSRNISLCDITLPKDISFVEIVGQKLSSQNRRSIVATAVEMFDSIRNYYASTDDAKKSGITAADFSFNSSGACPTCFGTGNARDGFGVETAEICQVCAGSRLNNISRLVKVDDRDIAEVLEMTIDELLEIKHSAFDKKQTEKLVTLSELRLGHLSLGRSTSTLSAGERQRLALARFIAHVDEQKTKGLLVLDEPTSGLAINDAEKIFSRIRNLAEQDGHTIVVLEHKIEFLKHSDWVIEFGPTGGPDGGKVIYDGVPKGITTAKTPTAEVLQQHSKPIKEVAFKALKSKNTAVEWGKSADMFESLALRHEIKDQIEFTPPVKPAIHYSINQINPMTHVGELLNLLPWAQSNSRIQLPKEIFGYEDEKSLLKFVNSKTFYFSPVSSEFRNGIAIVSDLKKSLKRLRSHGFTTVNIKGKTFDIKQLLQSALKIDAVNECLIECSSDLPQPLRDIGFRWSLGTVYVQNKSKFEKHTCNFATNESSKIGLRLSSRIVGDRYSPVARCVQCNGLGTVPTYPLNLIFNRETTSIESESTWHPSLSKALMSYGRRGIFPQAKFFKESEIADFIQPISKMDTQTRIIFEHGIPWRKFLRPNASRDDRESDYFGWRGIHDYVYLSLPAVTDIEYKNKMKAASKDISCPICQGTGMGWETDSISIKNNSLQSLWYKSTLNKWKNVGCNIPSLSIAIKLGLGAIKPTEHFESLSKDNQEKILVALTQTAQLEGLTLVSDDVINYKKEIGKISMNVVKRNDFN